ncbi:CoA transferase subunit A [Peribacillus butanolivorans]|uniref:CoA transferase subunit A n=1 Tax=Peribacillus TaxID=2675229 RepID=UPI001913CAA3|nr:MULTISPECIES: CoA transferase subunit A [unclassified Peribacillus]MBK5463083.1 CoA transferase subunit A [Peribacillus sp. TH27]MBK5501289.1 CoA transferase subunit A [Peribacillus sp. TH14]WMX53739.1 CoA transferase subunit A [Peribacillus sp. R9-11]
MLENSFQKICRFEDVLHLFKDNQSILFGGFGGIGTPPGLINLILESGIKNLTLIGNDTGFPEIGVGKLVTQRRAKKIIVSHIGSNPNAGLFMNNGELEVEFSPQGTLVERIRAGGMGLGGILTDIGLDVDIVRDGKQTIRLGEKNYLVEPALTADIAIVYAEKADPYGNLIFDKSARNTNPLVATAGQITIVEAVQIVPLGALNPEDIIVPGAFVDYIIPSKGVDWKWVWEPKSEID